MPLRAFKHLREKLNPSPKPSPSHDSAAARLTSIGISSDRNAATHLQVSRLRRLCRAPPGTWLARKKKDAHLHGAEDEPSSGSPFLYLPWELKEEIMQYVDYEGQALFILLPTLSGKC